MINILFYIILIQILVLDCDGLMPKYLPVQTSQRGRSRWSLLARLHLTGILTTGQYGMAVLFLLHVQLIFFGSYVESKTFLEKTWRHERDKSRLKHSLFFVKGIVPPLKGEPAKQYPREYWIIIGFVNQQEQTGLAQLLVGADVSQIYHNHYISSHESPKMNNLA